MRPTVLPTTDQRKTSVREAFRLQRMARAHRELWLFYLEHNLFGEARIARALVIEHLYGARQQWRLTLGLDRSCA